MLEQRRQQMFKIKRELNDLVLILWNVQEAIRNLKAAGANDRILCVVMTLMGFENVTTEELLATSTPMEIARIIRTLSNRSKN